MTYLMGFSVRNWACTAQSLSLCLLRKASDLVCSWPHGKLRAVCPIGEAWIGQCYLWLNGCSKTPWLAHLLLPNFTSWAEGCSLLVLPVWVCSWPQEPAWPMHRTSWKYPSVDVPGGSSHTGWSGSWTNGPVSETLSWENSEVCPLLSPKVPGGIELMLPTVTTGCRMHGFPPFPVSCPCSSV